MRARSRRSPSNGGNAATGLLFVGVVMAVLFAAGIGAVVATGSVPSAGGPPRPAPARLTAATSVADGAVAHRLAELVALRDAALARRDPALLDRVYAPASVNRRIDRASIAKLRRQHARWLGLASSVQVRTVTRTGPGRWVLSASLACAPARLVDDTGRGVGARPARRALLRFTLVLPAGRDGWLLERIAPARPSS
jgi:hypothetical protein